MCDDDACSGKVNTDVLRLVSKCLLCLLCTQGSRKTIQIVYIIHCNMVNLKFANFSTLEYF